MRRASLTARDRSKRQASEESETDENGHQIPRKKLSRGRDTRGRDSSKDDHGIRVGSHFQEPLINVYAFECSNGMRQIRAYKADVHPDICDQWKGRVNFNGSFKMEELEFDKELFREYAGEIENMDKKQKWAMITEVLKKQQKEASTESAVNTNAPNRNPEEPEAKIELAVGFFKEDPTLPVYANLTRHVNSPNLLFRVKKSEALKSHLQFFNKFKLNYDQIIFQVEYIKDTPKQTKEYIKTRLRKLAAAAILSPNVQDGPELVLGSEADISGILNSTPQPEMQLKDASLDAMKEYENTRRTIQNAFAKFEKEITVRDEVIAKQLITKTSLEADLGRNKEINEALKNELVSRDARISELEQQVSNSDIDDQKEIIKVLKKDLATRDATTKQLPLQVANPQNGAQAQASDPDLIIRGQSFEKILPGKHNAGLYRAEESNITSIEGKEYEERIVLQELQELYIPGHVKCEAVTLNNLKYTRFFHQGEWKLYQITGQAFRHQEMNFVSWKTLKEVPESEEDWAL